MISITIHRRDSKNNFARTNVPVKVHWGERSFVVPRGFEFDGASIPRFFWRLICTPLSPEAARGSRDHDWVYRKQPEGWTRKMADLMFYCRLIEDGLAPWRAELAYYGVRIGGRQAWNENRAVKATAEAIEELKAEAQKK